MFSGNPTKYCDYVFTAVDKDKSGTISFCEFMNVVALTATGNGEKIEKRLALVGLSENVFCIMSLYSIRCFCLDISHYGSR